jgi:hypothetical protein
MAFLVEVVIKIGRRRRARRRAVPAAASATG